MGIIFHGHLGANDTSNLARTLRQRVLLIAIISAAFHSTGQHRQPWAAPTEPVPGEGSRWRVRSCCSDQERLCDTPCVVTARRVRCCQWVTQRDSCPCTRKVSCAVCSGWTDTQIIHYSQISVTLKEGKYTPVPQMA